MEKVILVRYGEIHLKGLNRPYFQAKLLRGVKAAVKPFGGRASSEQGRMFIWDVGAENEEAAIEAVRHVFGVHSVSPAVAVDKTWDSILAAATELVAPYAAMEQPPSFKVFARRADKTFSMDSVTICSELGHALLQAFPDMRVDVRAPGLPVSVEIRDRAYLFTRTVSCLGGMPTGSAGRGMLLISGGIDSPVAGYMMAKRGLCLSAVHFYSYPYTSERARDKVVDLARIVSAYSGTIKLHLVPFTEIQLAIYDGCPEKETTVIMRRLMMEIAERLAVADGAGALITGEALGQVASQTMESLAATNDAVSMPVFRPLIGFDKEEITDVAKKIGTFETSIQPFEDCCTVFVPQHPVTRPKVEEIRRSEKLVDFAPMIDRAVSGTETVHIRPAAPKPTGENDE